MFFSVLFEMNPSFHHRWLHRFAVLTALATLALIAIGGLVISLFTPGPHLSEPHTFKALAEAGVVMLMF